MAGIPIREDGCANKHSLDYPEVPTCISVEDP